MSTCGGCYWYDHMLSSCRNGRSLANCYGNLHWTAVPNVYSFSTACEHYMEVRRIYSTSSTVEGSSITYVNGWPAS